MSPRLEGLIVEDLSKSFGATRVLHGVSLAVPKGQFHTLLGPSGSGKTTLLRLVAGFAAADGGRVTLAAREITQMPPEQRNIGVVFQNYALFPHMTVFDNVAFGLRMRKLPRAERAERVAEILRLVRMTGFEHRKPAALSGGQQQRVALARALVIRPALLLLDEPLSALDRKVRQEVREELKRIQAETRVTTVMVTHDQEEALYLADRVVVLDGGTIRQSGAPAAIYRRPVDDFVAGFLGAVNLLPVTVAAGRLCLAGREIAPPPGLACVTDGAFHLALRPEEITAARGEGPRPADAEAGRLLAAEYGGPVVTLRAECAGQTVSILALSPDILAAGLTEPGMPLWLSFRGGQLLPREARA
ncbi:ABC transporter ATP-binding protein [Acidisoma sp. C75]